jgi:hypothetical protein
MWGVARYLTGGRESLFLSDVIRRDEIVILEDE